MFPDTIVPRHLCDGRGERRLVANEMTPIRVIYRLPRLGLDLSTSDVLLYAGVGVLQSDPTKLPWTRATRRPSASLPT
jgi:hypothetical protein